MFFRAATALTLALLFTPPASHAQSNVHRCVGNDGQVSFTDRACENLHMQENAPPASGTGSTGKTLVVARSCARNRNELLSDVRNALETHDVNRLASSYLWTGMGTRDAYARMDRFSVVSARPLLDAQLLDGQSSNGMPDQIRIDQWHAAANFETETTIFQVVTAAGCVWIHD